MYGNVCKNCRKPHFFTTIPDQFDRFFQVKGKTGMHRLSRFETKFYFDDSRHVMSLRASMLRPEEFYKCCEKPLQPWRECPMIRRKPPIFGFQVPRSLKIPDENRPKWGRKVLVAPYKGEVKELQGAQSCNAIQWWFGKYKLYGGCTNDIVW